MGQLLETFWQLLQKASIHFTSGPSCATVYPIENCVHMGTRPRTFPAAFLVDAQSGENLHIHQLGNQHRKRGLSLGWTMIQP